MLYAKAEDQAFTSHGKMRGASPSLSEGGVFEGDLTVGDTSEEGRLGYSCRMAAMPKEEIFLPTFSNLQTNRTAEAQALPTQTRSLRRSNYFIDLTLSDDGQPTTQTISLFRRSQGSNNKNVQPRTKKLNGCRSFAE